MGSYLDWRGDEVTEPTMAQYMAALEAFKEVVKDLDVDWIARNPIQGEATPKVFAYRMAKAALSVEDDS